MTEGQANTIALELSRSQAEPMAVDGSQTIGRKGRTSRLQVDDETDSDGETVKKLGEVMPLIGTKDKMWLTAASGRMPQRLMLGL